MHAKWMFAPLVVFFALLPIFAHPSSTSAQSTCFTSTPLQLSLHRNWLTVNMYGQFAIIDTDTWNTRTYNATNRFTSFDYDVSERLMTADNLLIDLETGDILATHEQDIRLSDNGAYLIDDTGIFIRESGDYVMTNGTAGVLDESDIAFSRTFRENESLVHFYNLLTPQDPPVTLSFTGRVGVVRINSAGTRVIIHETITTPDNDDVESQILHLYNPITGERINSLEQPFRRIPAIYLSPTDDTVISISRDTIEESEGGFSIWDIQRGQLLHHVQHGKFMMYLSDGSVLYTNNEPRTGLFVYRNGEVTELLGNVTAEEANLTIYPLWDAYLQVSTPDRTRIYTIDGILQDEPPVLDINTSGVSGSLRFNRDLTRYLVLKETIYYEPPVPPAYTLSLINSETGELLRTFDPLLDVQPQTPTPEDLRETQALFTLNFYGGVLASEFGYFDPLTGESIPMLDEAHRVLLDLAGEDAYFILGEQVYHYNVMTGEASLLYEATGCAG